jgi:hypothetical protein
VGIEYHLIVPELARAKVATALTEELLPLLQRLDPKANEPFPNAYVKAIPEGIYVCDNLSDRVVAALIIRNLVDLLLFYSPEVQVVEP